MKYIRQLVFTSLWLLLAVPLAAQVAGFAGEDDDRDGLPDDFEQAILEKFKPVWRINPTDCNGLPAEFLPWSETPVVRNQNGAIYGQVFIRGSGAIGFFVEAHFYDLWAADCGYINGHALDAEHVSVLIRATDPSLPLTEWHASQWYAAAHEDTICDSSQFASAAGIDSEDKGATFWVARGKHGAFFSEQVCRFGGCGLDRCESSTVTLTSSPINLGEPDLPLNGAVWTSSDLWPLRAKMRSDFPTIFNSSSLSYLFPDRGSASFSTTGSRESTAIGYASIQANASGPSASGLSIFSVRRNKVLVTEAGVPASIPIVNGRIYAEVGGRVNTGVAIANPNDQPVQISFFFTDTNGRSFGQNVATIPAKGMLGRFLNDSPFNSGSFVRGSFTFTSSAPVAAVALRGLTNERNEFLITTLPVSSLPDADNQLTVIPHFADGGGWATQFVLVNPTDDPIDGSIEFLGQGTDTAPADPLEVTLNNQTGSQTGTTFRYAIAPRSSWQARTAGAQANVHVGSARLTPSSSSAMPSGLAILSFRRGGTIVTESALAAVATGSAFRLFAETSGNFDGAEPASLQTAVAIANLAETPATLQLEMSTMSGNFVGTSSELIVPGRGQAAMFLNQLPGFPALPSGFQGMLRISTTSPGTISVVGLRGHYNERGDFLLATIPAVNESVADSADSGGERLFPYFADGGGYTTQFILSSPNDGDSASGWLRFYSQTGVPFSLLLK